MEQLEEILEKTKDLKDELKETTIEPNKIWLDGKVLTLWEIQH